MTNRKLTLCAYCGESLANTTTSIDHIIPKQIGGCDKFSIYSCTKCNSNLSKIEQKAIKSDDIRSLLIELSESGCNLKTRRKKEFIPLQKSIGLSCGSPAKAYYNTITHEKALVFLNKPKVDPTDGQSHTFISPIEKNTPEEENALLCLTNKIVLGTCAWLWGDEFLRTTCANYLRDRLTKVDINEVLELNSNEKHLILEEKPEEDALNNQPHHSILIGKLGTHVIGLVNLFGCFESSTIFGEYNDNFNKWFGEKGVIIISKSTANEVVKMSWTEYEKFKDNNG